MSSFERGFSRRQLFEAGRELTIGFGFLVALGWGGRALYKRASENPDLVGKEIEGEGVKFKVTDALVSDEGIIDEIPLRSEPLLGENDNEISWTKPGQLLAVRAYYGVTHPCSNASMCNFTKDGVSYGRWYEAVGVLMFEKTKNDELVPMLDENGKQKKSGTVYIAGNFLRPATDAEVESRQR